MPDLKKNHHYVPQFWQRGFRNSAGSLYGRINGVTTVISPKRIMQDDYLYTVYDSHWTAADTLEDALALTEGTVAALFQRLLVPTYSASPIDRSNLCDALALQACRHPDVMRRGHRLSKGLGLVLAGVHELSEQEFLAKLVSMDVTEDDAREMRKKLLARTKEQLTGELGELNQLSPWDPQLPEQDALKALPLISGQLELMDIILLDAPVGCSFILSDTPMPQSNLNLGFSVPLSKSVAVRLIPTDVAHTQMTRRPATAAEVDDVNLEQRNRSLSVVIGPDAAQLSKL